jgi:hypothetical protein
MDIVIQSDSNITSRFWKGGRSLATTKITQKMLLIKDLEGKYRKAPSGWEGKKTPFLKVPKSIMCYIMITNASQDTFYKNQNLNTADTPQSPLSPFHYFTFSPFHLFTLSLFH